VTFFRAPNYQNNHRNFIQILTLDTIRHSGALVLVHKLKPFRIRVVDEISYREITEHFREISRYFDEISCRKDEVSWIVPVATFRNHPISNMASNTLRYSRYAVVLFGVRGHNVSPLEDVSAVAMRPRKRLPQWSPEPTSQDTKPRVQPGVPSPFYIVNVGG
jgi:hypothetical protein